MRLQKAGNRRAASALAAAEAVAVVAIVLPAAAVAEEHARRQIALPHVQIAAAEHDPDCRALAASVRKWPRGRTDNRVPRSAAESGRLEHGPVRVLSDLISLNVPAGVARNDPALRTGRKFGRPEICVRQRDPAWVIGRTWPHAQDSVPVLRECSDLPLDHHFQVRRVTRIDRGLAIVRDPATLPALALGLAPAAGEFSDRADRAKVVAEFNDPPVQAKVAAAFNDQLVRVKVAAAFSCQRDPVKTAAGFDPIDQDVPTVDRIVRSDPTAAPIDLEIAGPTSPIAQSSAAMIVLGDPVTALVPAAMGGRRGTAAKTVRGARMAMAIGDGMTTIITIIGITTGTISGMTTT
jgi:hypothetical protein